MPFRNQSRSARHATKRPAFSGILRVDPEDAVAFNASQTAGEARSANVKSRCWCTFAVAGRHEKLAVAVDPILASPLVRLACDGRLVLLAVLGRLAAARVLRVGNQER